MQIKEFSLKRYVWLIIVFFAVSGGSLVAINKVLNLDLDLSVVSWTLWVTLTGMMFIYIFLDAMRFSAVLKTLGIDLTRREIIKLTVIGTCVSNLTPFLAGGSIAQIYLLHQKGVHTGDAIAATSLRAMLASTFFFLSLPITLYFNIDVFGESFVQFKDALPYIILAYIAWIVFVVVFSFFYRKPLEKIKHHALKKPDSSFKSWSLKAIDELDYFLHSLNRFFRSKPSQILYTMFMTAIHFMFIFTFSVVIIRFLGYKIPYFKIITYQMLSNFIMYFGFTPGASGFAEGGFAYLFRRLISEDHVAVVVFLWRLFTVYIVTFIGFIVLIREMYQHRKRGLRHESISRQ